MQLNGQAANAFRLSRNLQTSLKHNLKLGTDIARGGPRPGELGSANVVGVNLAIPELRDFIAGAKPHTGTDV